MTLKEQYSLRTLGQELCQLAGGTHKGKKQPCLIYYACLGFGQIRCNKYKNCLFTFNNLRLCLARYVISQMIQDSLKFLLTESGDHLLTKRISLTLLPHTTMRTPVDESAHHTASASPCNSVNRCFSETWIPPYLSLHSFKFKI